LPRKVRSVSHWTLSYLLRLLRLYASSALRRRGLSPRRFNRGQERDSANRRRDPVEPARDHDTPAGFTDATRGAHRTHALWPRHEQRPHTGGSWPTVRVDARANSADRGQGAEEAEAPEPIKRTQELPQIVEVPDRTAYDANATIIGCVQRNESIRLLARLPLWSFSTV